MTGGQAFLIVGCFGVALFGVIMMMREKEQKQQRRQNMDELLASGHAPVTVKLSKKEHAEIEKKVDAKYAKLDVLNAEYDKLDAEEKEMNSRINAIFNEQQALIDRLNELDQSKEPAEFEAATAAFHLLDEEREELSAVRDQLFEKQKVVSDQRIAFFQPNIISSDAITSPVPTVTKNQASFTTDNKFLEGNGKSGIAIDKKGKQFAFLTPYNRVIVPFHEILSSEVVVDSDSIVKTDRIGQIGGAVVGGILTGGFGAVVMALGAKKKQIEKVRRIELKVLTKVIEIPSHTIVFYDNPQGGNGSYDMKNAVEWQDLISVAIHDGSAAIAAQKNQSARPGLAASATVADELKKLVELKKDGAITEDEFATLKSKLLQA